MTIEGSSGQNYDLPAVIPLLKSIIQEAPLTGNTKYWLKNRQ